VKSKGNEKSSGLFIAIYRSFEGSWRQKRMENPYGDGEGDVHDIGKIL
jgi:hypothetical protein